MAQKTMSGPHNCLFVYLFFKSKTLKVWLLFLKLKVKGVGQVDDHTPTGGGSFFFSLQLMWVAELDLSVMFVFVFFLKPFQNYFSDIYIIYKIIILKIKIKLGFIKQ